MAKKKEKKLSKKEMKARAKALVDAKLVKIKNKGKGKKLSKKELKAKAIADRRIVTKDKKKSKVKESFKKSKVAKAVARAVKGDNWDESEGSGGDYFKLKSGKHIGRIRSVISLGQVQFTFNKVLDDKATSALGLVIEVWSYKIKKGKVIITSKQPAIVYHVMKALNGNPKANYTKTKKALGIKSPDQFQGRAIGIELFTSEKGYMYVHGAMTGLGLAEAKATPKLTKKGYCIPNLDKMSKEALLDLNPITQVKDYILQAVNLEGTEAERLIANIRKSNPEYAKLRAKTKEKAKSKGKKSKKRLSEDAEY